MRWRQAGRFTNADKHPRQEQLRECGGEAASRGGRAPHSGAGGNDRNPVVPLGQMGNRDRAQHVEQHKARSAQQAQMKVGQPEFGADFFLNKRQENAIDHFENINHHQRAERIGAIVSRSEAGGDIGRDCCSVHIKPVAFSVWAAVFKRSRISCPPVPTGDRPASAEMRRPVSGCLPAPRLGRAGIARFRQPCARLFHSPDHHRR